MLINVRSDAPFQRFLDRREQELHVAMVPVIAAGVRMTVNRGSHNASVYVVQRAERVLVAHSKRIYREVFGSVIRERLTKQILDDEDNEDINDFMDSQLASLTLRASRSATEIAHSLANEIRDIVWAGVRDGESNQDIASGIFNDIGGISRARAATIARTETHGSAMEALDETIDYKEIEIATKTWWTAQDARVRSSHAVMHGVSIPRDQPFALDGGDLMFPGDDSLGAGAEEIINCRCAVLYETA